MWITVPPTVIIHMKTLSLPTSNSLRVTNSLRQARPRIPISAYGDYAAASRSNVWRHLHTRSTSPLGSGTVLQFSAMRRLLAPGHHHRAVGFAAPRAPSALPSPLPRPAAPRGRSQNPSCPQRRHRSGHTARSIHYTALAGQATPTKLPAVYAVVPALSLARPAQATSQRQGATPISGRQLTAGKRPGAAALQSPRPPTRAAHGTCSQP